MDFTDQVKQFAKRVETLKDTIQTEEATKTSIIMPFFAMLGYDVFNPLEFTPEFIADVGIKKGEKVDYAIMKNGEPVILIEAKATSQKLERHDSQLFRYFSTTKSKFAILTNGIIYRFYTDIDEINKMDKEPFFEFNITKIKDSHINELKKFKKELFDIDTLLDSACLLKYEKQFKKLFAQQLQEPTDDFIKLFVSSVYSAPKTQSVLDRFRPILKKSLNDYVNEMLNDKIMNALQNTETTDINVSDDDVDTKLSASDDELEGFFIIKTILKNSVDMRDLYYKKTDSYFVVLYKNNTRKWICRFDFTEKRKLLILPENNKTERLKIILENLNDIMDYKNKIIAILNDYIEPIEKHQQNTMSTNEVTDGTKINEVAYTVRLLPHPPKRKRTKPNKHLRKYEENNI